MPLKIDVFTNCDLVQNLHLNSGLLELENKGLIVLRWRTPVVLVGMDSLPVAPHGVMLKVYHNDNQVVRHYFDFHDVRGVLREGKLNWCDFYWKSNYHKDFIDKLPHTLISQVQPYGLYWPSRSRQDNGLVLRFLGHSLATMTYKWRKSRSIKQALAVAKGGRWERYMSRLFTDQYENHSPNRPIAVYFQPGVWQEQNAEHRLTNQERYRIIMKLRSVLGETFLGGFVNNPTSMALYPEATFLHSTTHEEYVSNIQRSQIVISTNGVDGCHS